MINIIANRHNKESILWLLKLAKGETRFFIGFLNLVTFVIKDVNKEFIIFLENDKFGCDLKKSYLLVLNFIAWTPG